RGPGSAFAGRTGRTPRKGDRARSRKEPLMNDVPRVPDYRALLQQAYLQIKDANARISLLEEAKNEPIAIIGMGCRFPGGSDDPESFWRMLRSKQSGIREVPPDRWDVEAFYDRDPEAPGKTYARHAGFIEQVDQFDAAFFGISPREAARMDPQQRLLLEVAWEALENAGQVVDDLSASRTGVFVGLCQSDYALMITNPVDIDAYTGTGTSPSVVAGRLSYLLNLRGPSIVVDTACSSSLVATHLACQSLRLRECEMAVAGGVSLMLSPQTLIVASKMHMLSTEGLCKPFDAGANGTVGGEGCGVVILKRLSDALKDRDRILALIRGSAVNQDGRSTGLTAPNGPSQQTVIRQALQNAGVTASQVSYIEAHGTGTPLGDPIEVEALAAIYGRSEAGGPAGAIGAVKANIGHLTAAAGIAGLIKVVLALE